MRRYGDHVTLVACQAEGEHGKLMTLQGVLQQPERERDID